MWSFLRKKNEYTELLFSTCTVHGIVISVAFLVKVLHHAAAERKWACALSLPRVSHEVKTLTRRLVFVYFFLERGSTHPFMQDSSVEQQLKLSISPIEPSRRLCSSMVGGKIHDRVAIWRSARRKAKLFPAHQLQHGSQNIGRWT